MFFFFTRLLIFFLGVDFVLDFGASGLQRNIKCCNIYTGSKVAIVDLGGENYIRIDFIALQLMQAEIKGKND